MKISQCITAAVALAFVLTLPHGARAQTAVSAPSLSACVWSHVSDTDKAEIAASYHAASQAGITQHMSDFTQFLDTKNDALRQAFTACDSTPNIPESWVSAIIAAQAIQFGASNELALSPHPVSRTDLDTAWTEAPQTAHDCVRAHAGKVFGVTDVPCPAPKAIFWYLTRFGIAPKSLTDRNDGAQILIYDHARAEQEWGEALIDRFDKKAAAKPD